MSADYPNRDDWLRIRDSKRNIASLYAFPRMVRSGRVPYENEHRTDNKINRVVRYNARRKLKNVNRSYAVLGPK